MKPRASASFCHWPKETSTPPGQVGPSCVSSPAGQPRDDVVGPGALDGADDGGLVVEPGHVADADGLARAELEAEEVLEGAGEALAPLVGRHARQRLAVHEDRARRGLVELGEQLDERGLAGAVLADDGDDRARGQLERHVVQHEAVGAGVGEGDVIEADALAQLRRHGQVGVRDQRRRVVLEPGEALGAVHPDAAQEADLADGGADVRGQARAGREDEQHVARGGSEPRRDEDDGADVGAAEHGPGERVPRGRAPAGAGDGPVPALPGLAALARRGARRCR